MRAKDKQKEREAVNRGVVAGGKDGGGGMVGEKDGVNANKREKTLGQHQDKKVHVSLKKNLENRQRQGRRQDGGSIFFKLSKGWGSRWEGEKSV